MKNRKEFVRISLANKEASKALLLEHDLTGAVTAFQNFDELKDMHTVSQIKADLELVPDHLLSRLKPRQYYPFAHYMLYENVMLEVKKVLKGNSDSLSADNKYVTIGLLFILLIVKAPNAHFSVDVKFTPDTGVKFKAEEVPFINGFLKVLHDDPKQLDTLFTSLKGTDGKLGSMLVLSEALSQYRGPRVASGPEVKADAQSVNPSAFKLLIQSLINWVKDLIQAIKDKLSPAPARKEAPVPEFAEAPVRSLSSMRPK